MLPKQFAQSARMLSGEESWSLPTGGLGSLWRRLSQDDRHCIVKGSSQCGKSQWLLDLPWGKNYFMQWSWRKKCIEYGVWQQSQEKHVLSLLEMSSRFRFTYWNGEKKNSSLFQETKLLFAIHQPVITQKQTSQYLIQMICVLLFFPLWTGLA